MIRAAWILATTFVISALFAITTTPSPLRVACLAGYLALGIIAYAFDVPDKKPDKKSDEEHDAGRLVDLRTCPDPTFAAHSDEDYKLAAQYLVSDRIPHQTNSIGGDSNKKVENLVSLGVMRHEFSTLRPENLRAEVMDWIGTFERWTNEASDEEPFADRSKRARRLVAAIVENRK